MLTCVKLKFVCNDQKRVCQNFFVKITSAFVKTFFIKKKLANNNICQILFCKDEKCVCPKFVCNDQKRVCQNFFVKVTSAFVKTFFIKKKLVNDNLCQILFCKDEKQIFCVTMNSAYVKDFL